MRSADNDTSGRLGRTALRLLAIAAVLIGGLAGGTVAGAVSASGSPSIPRSAAGGPGRDRGLALTRLRAANRRTLLSAHRMRSQRRAREAAETSAAPLEFGIYPGGGAGTVGPSGNTKPEVADLRLQALDRLRGGAPTLVLHLYDDFRGPAGAASPPAWLQEQIDDYTAHGYKIELVLRYRPADPAGDVAGFVDLVRARVRQLGADRGVTDLQITNEVNVGGAPDAADGAYPGARDALVRGVIAAKDEARRTGADQLRIGFNWAYQTGRPEQALFSYLSSSGGRAFARAVDWVGVDAYPGTWGPALPRGDLASGVSELTIDAMRTLRKKLLPLAGLSNVAMHFAESGYPTGPGRTEAMQDEALRAAVETISANRASYGVTGYRWFDLRDADSAGGFESQYGITRDDYSPKAGFFTYRDLIAKLG